MSVKISRLFSKSFSADPAPTASPVLVATDASTADLTCVGPLLPKVAVPGTTTHWCSGCLNDVESEDDDTTTLFGTAFVSPPCLPFDGFVTAFERRPSSLLSSVDMTRIGEENKT
jgi:hypothetical protein